MTDNPDLSPWRQPDDPDAARRTKSHGEGSPSRKSRRSLLAQGLQSIVCGRSALAKGLGNEDLLPGLTMALSQTAATSVLQQQGYEAIP